MSARRVVHLIRHGETPGNAGRIFQLPETPLGERGFAQAARLADRLAGEGIARIVASDYARARQTAQAVSERCALPFDLDPLLRERNFGDLRGTSYADFDGDPFALDYEPAGGETWKAFHQRVERAWQSLLRRSQACEEGALAVVTHGLVCDAIVRHHVAPETQTEDGGILRFGNTSLTILHGPSPWRVELLGCTAHLDAESGDDANAISGL